MVDSQNTEFKVNEYITLKLEGENTVIYINEEEFMICKFLLLNIPIESISTFDDIDSIDEAAERLDNALEPVVDFKGEIHRREQIPSDTEFWGHCSNLQVWSENNYDTRLLHRNIAFPLLKKLNELGDPLAKEVFLSEISKRIINGTPQVVLYLIENDYTQHLIDNNVKLDVLINNQVLKEFFTKVLHEFIEIGFIFLDLLLKLQDVTAEKIFKNYVYTCLEKTDYQKLFKIKDSGFERFLPSETFEKFKNAESLDLHRLKLQKIPNLEQFQNLKVLDLSSNKIIEITRITPTKI